MIQGPEERATPIKDLGPALEALYCLYNKREYVSPDPLQFLYEYRDPKDQEIAGLVAASLAYGRVQQILKGVGKCLKILGKSPRDTLLGASKSTLSLMFQGFRYRFTRSWAITGLLLNARRLIGTYGSIGMALYKRTHSLGGSFLDGVSWLAEELSRDVESGFLLPDPAKGSACKRLFLYLRWMIRLDAVDPGCWREFFSPSVLLVPVDIHLFRIARALGLTQRRRADLKSAMEITERFRSLAPEDPARYDFVLTRFGINPDFKKKKPLETFFDRMNLPKIYENTLS